MRRLLAAAALCALAAPTGAAVPTVVSNGDYTLALAKDGKVFAWGSDARGQLGSGRPLYASTPRKVTGLPPVVWVDGGTRHVAAVDWLGKVWTWGRDDAGQLGRRSVSAPTRPGQVLGVSNVTRVTASKTFTAALRSNGTVMVWGTFAGALRKPEAVAGLSSIVDIRSGYGHLVALKADGTVWTVGSNDYGERGDGTASTTPTTTAQQVTGLAGIARIGAGPCGSIAVKNDGTVLAWGRAACAATTPRYTPTAVPGLSSVVEVAGGFDHSHAVLANGSVREWDNAYAPAMRPNYLAVTQIVADTQLETLALLANGTVTVMGDNHLGQHGQGHTDPIAGISLTNLVNVTGIATAHTGDREITHFARLANGELYAWGGGFDGQLGDGAPMLASVPTRVAGLPDVSGIAAGDATAYAVDVDGFAWAWGDNVDNALGLGTATPQSTPKKIPGLTGVKDVAAGSGFVLFLMADGSVQLQGGVLAPDPLAAAAPVAGLASIASIVARGHNAWAIATDGAVMAWGRGTDGLVGDGTTIDRAAPVPVTAFNAPVTMVSAGSTHALARTSDGGAWSWGTDTANGVLGDGVAGSHTQAAPARIAALVNVAKVSAGESHSLALLATGLVRSWGSASLGDGATSTRNTPGPVRNLANVASIAAGRFASWAVDLDGAVSGWGGATPRGSVMGATLGAPVGDGTFVHRGAFVMTLAPDAQGNLDAADWYLDLDASVANTAHAAPAAFVPVARGSLAAHSVSLDAGIHFRAADSGRKVGTYVLGYVPPEFLAQPKITAALSYEGVQALIQKSSPVMVQLTPAGWAPVEGLLVPFTQGAASGNGAFEGLLNGVDPAAIPGARFCIGFGEDGGTMLAAGAIAEVLVVEPASPVPSAVPCATEGVYLDGPRETALGTPARFTATVLGDAPSGSVRFSNAFTPVAAAIALVASGPNAARASRTFNGLGTGQHAIGAAYAGDASNPAASSDLPLLHTVTPPPITGSYVDIVLSGPPSALEGSESFFRATVIGQQPTGTVQFREVGTSLGPPAPIIDGVATLRISSLPPGLHLLNALYSGDAVNTTRVSNTFPHTVTTSPGPEVVLTLSTVSPLVGTPVTLTATVEGAPVEGTVQFLDNDVALANPKPLSGGKVTLTTESLAAGAHLLTAVYERDLYNRSVSSTVRLSVALAIDTTNADGDADGDGIPNPVEVDVARNPFAMDNDFAGDAKLFTMQQYRDFLGREGDPNGIAFWTQAIDNGTFSRAQVVEDFFRSPEFRQTVSPVVRLYFAYFLRIPDYEGLNFWIGEYRNGRTLQSISEFFAQSAEFRARYGALNNSGFVQLVYNNVLGRQPDNVGFNFWVSALSSGTWTRGQMMAYFAESPEYQGLSDHEVYVTMMYMGLLRRAPDPDGFSFWVNWLDTDHTGLALIQGFLDSPEYRARFLP